MTLQWFLHVYRSYKVPFRRVWWWFRFYLNARVIASSICTQRASMYKDSLPCIRRMDGFSHTTYIDCECRLGPRQNLVDPHRVMLPCMRVLCTMARVVVILYYGVKTEIYIMCTNPGWFCLNAWLYTTRNLCTEKTWPLCQRMLANDPIVSTLTCPRPMCDRTQFKRSWSFGHFFFDNYWNFQGRKWNLLKLICNQLFSQFLVSKWIVEVKIENWCQSDVLFYKKSRINVGAQT